ncbi:MAG: PilZ domain-containing protein [Nitrospirae bacterium]|nr:PilZ domain-containing protein [Nitrospirota bacterium]
MGLLSWLTGNKGDAPKGALSNPKEVEFILRTVIAESASIDISFIGDDAAFHTRLLERGKEKGKPYLAIGTLDPPEGNTSMKRNRPFEVLFRHRDVAYTFRGSLLAAVDGGYKITPPPYLMRTQKRSFFRIIPSYQDPVFVSFVIRGETYKEKVEDVSEGGFSFSTNLAADVLSSGLTLENTILYLPDDTLFLTCIVKAHFPSKDSASAKFRAGVQIQRMDANDQQALARYIFKRQREMLLEEREAAKKA